MGRHVNKFNHSYADGVPLGTGDRYFAQDLARDHRYLQGLAAQALADLLGTDSAVLLRGGAVTAASATTINVAAAVGLCDFDVSVPDDSAAWAVPAAEAMRQIKTRVSLPAQVGLSLAALGATLDGSTVNYLKLRYAEADVQSRPRQYAGGTYAHAKGDSFALSCDPAAPTAYDVLLATVVGNGSTIPTVTKIQPVMPTSSPVTGALVRRDSSGRMKASTPNAVDDVAVLATVQDQTVAPHAVVTITSGSGNWTVPNGVHRIKVKCVGGGGGGGASYNYGSNYYGGGGGGGTIIGNVIPTILNVSPGTNIAYSVGVGGSGGNAGDGGDGGVTTFGSVTGAGGGGARYATGGLGGRGGAPAAGGAGAAGSPGVFSAINRDIGGSGGGAGGAGSQSTGSGSGTGGVGGYGGGGGGGHGTAGIGGNGGSGIIIIEY